MMKFEMTFQLSDEECARIAKILGWDGSAPQFHLSWVDKDGVKHARVLSSEELDKLKQLAGLKI